MLLLALLLLLPCRHYLLTRANLLLSLSTRLLCLLTLTLILRTALLSVLLLLLRLLLGTLLLLLNLTTLLLALFLNAQGLCCRTGRHTNARPGNWSFHKFSVQSGRFLDAAMVDRTGMPCGSFS